MWEVDSSSFSQVPGLGYWVHKELFEWLIPVAYDRQQAEFAHRRHPGTLQWFLDTDTYQKWIHATSDLCSDGQPKDLRTLFCPGPAGAGKTILTSAVIQDLGHRFGEGSGSNVGIAYLYCFYNCQEQQSTTNLLLVLLEQLVSNRSHHQPQTRVPSHTQERFSPPVTSPPSLAKIMKSLEEVIAKYDHVFFVLDGLDECAPGDRNALLKELFRLQTESKVHLFATSDSDSDVEHMFANAPSLEIQANQEDVRSYLGWGMDELPAFVKEDPAVREEIKDTIIKVAPGSFLAAVLQLKSLVAMSSTEEVRAALVDVAKDSALAHYDALYEAAMRRIESQSPNQVGLAKQTLSYMLCARGPWTAAELCHALTVKVGEFELDWDAMPSLRATIAACSGMLVTIGSEKREENKEIDDLNKYYDNDEAAMARLDRIAALLVHRTAHEYLQRTYERWLPEAEEQMAATCMAYLSLRYFDNGPCCCKSHLEMRLQKFPLYFYAALHWGLHARIAFHKFPDMSSMKFRFLSSSALIEASCDVVFRVGQWPRDEDFPGDYPSGMNGLHIAAYFGITNLVCALGSRVGTMINAVDEWGFAALAWAANEGHEETVKAILGFRAIDVNIRDSRGRTPISLAAGHSHTSIVKELLDHGANPSFKDFRQATPLWHAAKGGHTTTVALLTRRDIDLDVASGAPPDSAAWHDHEKLIQLLLNIDMTANAQRDEGETPLHLAIDGLNGTHDGIARLLISNANLVPDLINKYGDKLALLAVSHGRIEILRLLLAKGVDTEARTKDGLTLLGVAAQQGYLPIVELLLATNGVKADSRNAVGRTPLALAANPNPSWDHSLLDSKSECVRDYCRVIQCLLDSGCVDINSRDDSGQTPLIHATICSDHAFPSLRLLLDHEGVEVDAMDKKGQTALSRATVMGKEDKAKLLLEKGADPDLGRTYGGETLLSHAAGQGMADLVRALISHHGVDAQERNSDGHTALCKAAASNEVEVFEVLLDVRGVDFNARCRHGKTPLHHAVNTSWGEEVALLLLARGSPGLDAQDISGKTPLHLASESGSEALVSSLLEAGVATANCRDSKGRTPLSLAAQKGQIHIVEKLLSFKGVIPDIRDETGRTPLSWSIQSKSTGASAVIKRLLVAEGIDSNAEDEGGWTALSWAVQDGNASDLVELLLTEGAGRIDINHEDWKGRTPLALALEKGNEVIVGQLRAAGAREKGLNEYRVFLNNDEDGRQDGMDMTRKQADGPAWDMGGETEQESDWSSQSSMSGEDSWQDDLENPNWWKERARRRRWLNPNWFDDTPANGDGDSNHSRWSGTIDFYYNQSASRPSVETQVELGAQNEAASRDEGREEEELCHRCKALDLNKLFSCGPPGGFRVIAHLGKVDESWESRPCAMCKLLAAVRPRGGDEDCELCAYSSTAMWLSGRSEAAEHYFMSNWTDTVILGVEHEASRHCTFGRGRVSRSIKLRQGLDGRDVMPHGFISRVGSNDRHRLRSLTVHRLQKDQVDFGRARGWIACCAAHHGRRCNPSTHRSITSFRLIDCITRDIVDGQSAIDQFVALSYVWGPTARKLATVDHVRVENAERVVEDAIRATQALGFRYLWVDRHCITNQDEGVRKKQLLEMNAVYASAQVTIVAAAGEDSAFGLPGVSCARQQPCASVQGHSLAVVPREPAESIKGSVWWTRGWTFQEGVLSRRRLVFTEHEVSYECRGMVARESVELPERIHRIAATRYPIHEDSRVFSPQGYRTYNGGSVFIWSQISDYTERHLTHDYDILNAMLGIMEVAAERKIPIHHLCGVPIVLGISGPANGLTLLEAFATGLCWKVPRGTRREGFPSWSWTGWKGKAYEPNISMVSFKFGFAIDVSMVPRDGPSGTVSWAEFEAMGPKERAALPQDYILEITGAAVDVSIRWNKTRPSYAILYSGDDAFEGSVTLCKDPKREASFLRQLAEERLTAIVIGNEDIYTKPLVLLALAKVGDYWERIGVITVRSKHVLDVHGGGCRKQTFLIR